MPLRHHSISDITGRGVSVRDIPSEIINVDDLRYHLPDSLHVQTAMVMCLQSETEVSTQIT